MFTYCEFCGLLVEPGKDSTWKEVSGFVGGPHKDGMCLRTDTGKYAHDSCVQKAKSGQASDQEELRLE
jgi:hypothetical protein